MLTKFKKFISTRTTQDWVSIGLWIGTLVMLLTFVIYDAVAQSMDVNTSNPTAFANNMAALGVVTALVLFTAIVITVVFAYLKRKRGK